MSFSKISPNVMDGFLTLPALRFFSSMANTWSDGTVHNQSGDPYFLTAINNPQVNVDADNLSYMSYNGISQYHYHADDQRFDITGLEPGVDPAIRGLTVGGWFWVNDLVLNPLISKWVSAGNQKSYFLDWLSGSVRFFLSQNGVASVNVSGSASVSAWVFVVGRFVPGATLDIFTNKAKDTTIITETSIYDSSAQFIVGRLSTGAIYYLNGRSRLCFVCAAALPDSAIYNLYDISKPS